MIEATARAYGVGVAFAELHILNIATHEPHLIGEFSGDGYTHGKVVNYIGQTRITKAKLRFAATKTR